MKTRIFFLYLLLFCSLGLNIFMHLNRPPIYDPGIKVVKKTKPKPTAEPMEKATEKPNRLWEHDPIKVGSTLYMLKRAHRYSEIIRETKKYLYYYDKEMDRTYMLDKESKTVVNIYAGNIYSR